MKQQAESRLLKAIPHIANDMLVLRQARDYSNLRIGWTTWYVMARNVAIFFELPNTGGRSNDIFCSEYLSDTKAFRCWTEKKEARLGDAPPALGRIQGDASQAAAHLSWLRLKKREVQAPSPEVTAILLGFWGDFVTCVPEPYRSAFKEEWHRLNRGSLQKPIASANAE